MRSKLLATALLAAVLVVTGSPTAFAQSKGDQARVGVPAVGAKGVQETVEQIMAREAATPPRLTPRLQPEHELPARRGHPQNRLSPARATWPAVPKSEAERRRDRGPFAPQTLGINFLGATLADTGAFPPDTMGAVGPTQFVVFVNGRVRTFNKATGVADGVINADADVFFNSVMTPVTPPLVINFTSDPQVRYDRLSGRWILTIIDVPGTAGGYAPNRLLIAVSDAASAGVLSAGTVWTFYFVQQNTVGGGDTGDLLDYPSLGVDANALYVGGNMFDPSFNPPRFRACSAFVIRKTSVLSGGPLVVTPFRGIATQVLDGPAAPRGVDNYNPASNEGYIVGVSLFFYDQLNLRRVSTPGGVPVLSADIPIAVNTTSTPIPVNHLGNTGGSAGRLDAIDDRLFAAHIRNGRLWTAHNIAVTATGVASDPFNPDPQERDGVRWYELNVPVGAGAPSVVQSGTIFDTAATVATARQFLIPSVMVSGQGHAALGFSTAGTPFRANAATVGRLVGDTLGTTQGAPVLYTNSTTAYNPPGDDGGGFARRWGDYSFTSLDPNDDMTLWTIQQYCSSANFYGVQVVKLIAPPPATPSCAVPAQVTTATQNVTITGTSTSGSGFFDPGVGFTGRLQASVTGGVTVNSVTYNNPTSVTLNVTATTSGLKNVTFTNPDGQSVTGTGCINVLANLSITKTDGQATYLPGAPITYTIVASNAGPGSVTGVTVADTPPAAITGATWTCSGAGGGTCFPVGAGSINDATVSLPVGGSVTYSLSGTISAAATGNLSNTATVTVPAGVTDPNLANNSATDTDTPLPADLSITKTDGQTTYGPTGSPIVYTIVASNAGPSPVIGATVADTLPAGITGATWVCSGAGGGTCAPSGSVSINDTVNLPAGGSVTYTLSGTISASAIGNLSNTATVTAPAGVTDPSLANNSATDTDIASGQNYFTVPPCRVVDTRGGAPNGGPILQGQQTRVFVVAGNCGIPPTAKAVSVNLAVTLSTAAGNVRLFPTGQPVPTVSSINYSSGQTRANNAVVTLDASGQMSAFVGQTAGTTVHLIVDVNGYFQ